MYPVRETRTSKLRAAREPNEHALFHIKGIGTSYGLNLSGGQESRTAQPKEQKKTPSALVVSKPRSHSPVKPLTKLEGPTSSQSIVQSPAIDSKVEAELASRELTISELQGKLQLSEQHASEQAALLAKYELALTAKDSKYNRMASLVEAVRSNDNKYTERLKDILGGFNNRTAKKDRDVPYGAELLETDQKMLALQRERTQDLEEKPEKTGSLQMQEVARMQQELEHNRVGHSELVEKWQTARAEAQLRQEVSNLRKQLRRSKDMLKKFQDKEQGEQARKEELLSQVTKKLIAKDKEFAILNRTLKEEQQKSLGHALSVKLHQEQIDRFSAIKAELEHRNAALEKENVRLKLEVRSYAEIIVGNEGEPFYEVRQSDHEKKREAKASEDIVPIINKGGIANESAQTGQSRGREPDPGHHTPRGAAPNQQPQQRARRG